MHNPEMANDFHRHTSLLETFAVQLAFAAAGFASSFFRATERQAGGSNEVPGRDQRNARSLHPRQRSDQDHDHDHSEEKKVVDKKDVQKPKTTKFKETKEKKVSKK